MATKEPRIEVLRWTDFGEEDFPRTQIAEALGCGIDGSAACLLCQARIAVFPDDPDDSDAPICNGLSLILLHRIPGQGYLNIVCQDCAADDEDDELIVGKVAARFGVARFSSNIA